MFLFSFMNTSMVCKLQHLCPSTHQSFLNLSTSTTSLPCISKISSLLLLSTPSQLHPFPWLPKIYMPNRFLLCNLQFFSGMWYSTKENSVPFLGKQLPTSVLWSSASFELRCLKDEATLWIGPELFHVIGIDTRTQTLKITRFYDPSMGNIACPY